MIMKRIYTSIFLVLLLSSLNLKSQSFKPNISIKVSYIYNALGINLDNLSSKLSDMILNYDKNSGFGIGVSADASFGMVYLLSDLEYRNVGFSISSKDLSKTYMSKFEYDNLSLSFAGGISILDIAKFYLGLTFDMDLDKSQKKQNIQIDNDLANVGFRLGANLDVGFVMLGIDYRDKFNNKSGYIKVLESKNETFGLDQSMSMLSLSLYFIII